MGLSKLSDKKVILMSDIRVRGWASLYQGGEVIEKLELNRLEKGGLAIFCGAGISVNSSIPAAWTIISALLQALRVESDDSKAIVESSIPFELLMEIFDDNLDVSPLFSIFQLGQPNNNHFLIARFAKLGFVRAIVTTNFDTHIENALDAEGVRYKVLCEENEFEAIENQSYQTVVVKLHGTVDKPESIRTTLRAVASGNLSEKRGTVIRHVFSSGPHKKVLVLGYSCSDIDLVPHIQSIDGPKKNVVYIKHEEMDGFELLALREVTDADKGPVLLSAVGRETTTKVLSALGGYPCDIIVGDADIFINKLASENEISLPTMGRYQNKERFQSSVDLWAKSLVEKGYDLHVVGLIFTNICEYDKAIEYFDRNMVAIKARGDERDEADCLGNIANVYRAKGNYEVSLKYHEEAKSIFNQIRDEDGEAGCYLNMGNILNQLGRFQEAFDCHEWALSAFKKNKDQASMATCFLGHGDTYRFLNQQSEALKCYNEALKIKHAIGDVMGVAVCHGNLGSIYCDMGDVLKSENEYLAARKLYESIGYWKGISNSDIGLANTLILAGKADEALKLCESVLSKNEKIGDREGIATCHAIIGEANYLLGNIPQAICNLESASHEFNISGQKMYEQKVNALLSKIRS